MGLLFSDFNYHLDGGTIDLFGVNELGEAQEVSLQQHLFPTPPLARERISGRLYYNGDLISLRSDKEGEVLKLLRECQVDHAKLTEAPFDIPPGTLVLPADVHAVYMRSPEENLLALASEIVAFVESDAYLQFAKRVEAAKDLTPYAVYIDWTPETRNQAIIRLARFRNISIGDARKRLDLGRPEARGISALEVDALVQHLASLGLAVRIEPPYPWDFES